MELIAVVFMVVFGGAIAAGVMLAVTMLQRDSGEPQRRTGDAPDRDRLAASILYQIVLAGGATPDQALRDVRRGSGIGAPVTAGIDIPSWGEAFAQMATRPQREALLETAVQLIATSTTPIPLRQYVALLDLSFALGFHTDALARLRERYGFDYIDHAKDARPREADRIGGATPLFVREQRDPGEWLRVLEIEGTPTRAMIISAYRRLAAQHHPDRFYDQPEAAQSTAAARFIELTRAYEALLTMYRD